MQRNNGVLVRAFGWMAGTALVALAPVVAGCDDAVPLEDFPAKAEEALCLAQVACGAAPDVMTCHASVFFGDSADLLTLMAAVNRGTIRYDEDLAGECLRDFSRGCLVSSGDSSSTCDAAFRGVVAVGGACVINRECVEGSCVAAAGCTSACCVGRCVAAVAVALGGACGTAGPPCVAGGFCRGGRCVARLAVGSVCSLGDLCEAPAFCSAPSDDDDGVCVMPAEEGMACNPTHLFPCLRRYDYCDVITRRCLPREKPGAGCASDTAACVPYAPCRAGVCTPSPTVGRACGTAAAGTCLGELRCTAGICTAPITAVACTP